ncbi:interleukin-5 receptor subunit alpha-like isoform X2 [Archocentrus centrarchus]|uniref:interleukin-5 receptor subunit alpha-like isoform X2 n=1 Tax=Archocentrus centrarchus TaxID=63155 RepID=UPI0011EA15A6|nr:interleukin-5 receptor subunit alpha-like isoform X2 [Archocentrus centrarchus]
MAVFPVHPVMWSSLLVLWLLQSEAEGHSLDLCQKYMAGDYELSRLSIKCSTGLECDEDPTLEQETFICLLYPTNELNCSWSFNTSEMDAQLTVCISVCGDETETDSTNCTSVEKVGWMPLALSENIIEESTVVLHLNVSQHNNWTSYTFVYDVLTLELLSPPPNISASFSDRVLNVSWDLPHNRQRAKSSCFEYELDISDQDGPKHVVGKQNFITRNADPAHTHRVRMRTRILNEFCEGSRQWSEWSPTVTVSVEPSEPPVCTLSPLVIAFICLGIPMILLAVLLFVRYQRVTKILFPPIPRPPPKYKYFLEKSDAFNFFSSTTSAKPEEEITEVEDTEKNPGRTE